MYISIAISIVSCVGTDAGGNGPASGNLQTFHHWSQPQGACGGTVYVN